MVADATILGLVSTRIYPAKLPQNPTFPAVTYQRVSRQGVGTFATAAKLPAILLQVDSWALNYEDSKTLAAAVQTALDNYRGTVDGHTIQAVILESDSDIFEDAVQPPVYRVEAEYRVWFNA